MIGCWHKSLASCQAQFAWHPVSKLKASENQAVQIMMNWYANI